MVPSELRELNNVVGGAGPQVDIVAMAPTSITYRAMRGLGFVCQVTAGEIRLLKGDQWSAYRDPIATRDAAYIFIENDRCRGVPTVEKVRPPSIDFCIWTLST